MSSLCSCRGRKKNDVTGKRILIVSYPSHTKFHWKNHTSGHLSKQSNLSVIHYVIIAMLQYLLAFLQHRGYSGTVLNSSEIREQDRKAKASILEYQKMTLVPSCSPFHLRVTAVELESMHANDLRQSQIWPDCGADQHSSPS